MATSSSAAFELPMEEGMPELIDEDEVDVPSTLPSLLEQNLDTESKGDGFKLVKRKRKSANAVDVDMEDVSQPDADGAEEADASDKQKSAKRSKGTKGESRVVPVPKHRYTPLKENWVSILTPIVKNLGLQVRFNLQKRQVEIRNPEDREDTTDLQKATDFVRAFILGFEVNDAIALIRLDHLFLETFEIKM
uniref:RNA-binding protein PNO1 n=1 Tax=Caenorhabditis japonica TaxID=281687 RepID=A0A8R1DYA0_CAEJA